MSKRTDLPRNPRDLYETHDPKAVKPIAPLWHGNGTRYIEPFCGSGELINNIGQQCDAVCVYASDIQPLPKVKGVPSELYFNKHGVFTTTLSVLSMENIAVNSGATHFISNPPWINTKESGYQLLEIINHLSNILPTWLLLNGNFAFNKRSSDSMAICTDIVTVGRLKWIKGSQHSATEDSCWFLFDQKRSDGRGPTIHPRVR
jgi:hypothetical protein